MAVRLVTVMLRQYQWCCRVSTSNYYARFSLCFNLIK